MADRDRSANPDRKETNGGSSAPGSGRGLRFRIPNRLLLPFSSASTIGTAQAAEMLGVSRDTVERMIEAGELQAYKTRPNTTGPWKISYDSVLQQVDKIHSDNALPRRYTRVVNET